jgi:rubrerythrin
MAREEHMTADLVSRLHELETAERDVATSMDMRAEDTANWQYAETAKEAAAEIERLRGQLDAAAQHVRILQAQVASFAPALDVEARRGDPNYVAGKAGHYWTCAKCQYVNDSGIRFNRCGECGEFEKGYADTRG